MNESPAVERALGVPLVLLAVAIPVGEGVSWIALGVLAVACALHHRAVASAVTALSGASMPWLGGLGLCLGAGAAAWLVGGEGADLREAARWAPLGAAPLVAIAAAAAGPAWRRRAATAFVSTLAVAALFGVVQVIGDVRPGEGIVRTLGAGSSQGRRPGDPEESAAGGFYFHRLMLAHVLLVGTAVVAGRVLAGRFAGAVRLWATGVALLFVTALSLTFSTAAVLAAATALGAALFLKGGPARRRILVGILLATIAAVALPAGRARLAAGVNASVATRSLIWRDALDVIADHPWGVGLGNTARVASRYHEARSPGLVPERAYAHDVLLSTWVECGPFGAAAFLWAWLAFAFSCARVARARAGVHATTAAWAGLLGTIALGTSGLVHDVLYHRPVAFAFAALWGGVAAALPTSTHSQRITFER